MFIYHSEQVHSEFTNKKGRTKVHSVSIKGKKGTKSVIVYNRSGRMTKKASKSLTKKEIDCIRTCKFIPGLFRDCTKCIKKT